MRTAEILPLLPEVLRDAAVPGSPLLAVVDTMAGLHARDEVILSELDAWFDPYRTPDRFLPYLAGWVDLGWLPIEGSGPRIGEAALRHLIATAPRLAQLRGTTAGLRLLLRTATGIEDIDVAESGTASTIQPFHLVVHVPAGAAAMAPLVELLVRGAKPAHVTCAVVTAPAREITPPPEGSD